MKSTLTILLAFIVLAGCKSKPVEYKKQVYPVSDWDTTSTYTLLTDSNPNFHVAVIKESTEIFRIDFTKNNWKTTEHLKVYDTHDESLMYSTGSTAPATYYVQKFHRYSDAVTFAKKFNTYEKCAAYNKKQYAFYLHDHPIIPVKTIIY